MSRIYQTTDEFRLKWATNQFLFGLIYSSIGLIKIVIGSGIYIINKNFSSINDYTSEVRESLSSEIKLSDVIYELFNELVICLEVK